VSRLRAESSDVSALLMSGRLVPDDAVQERLKVSRTLQKPFGVDAFVETIRRLLAGLVT
jgi:hypothetical protein